MTDSATFKRVRRDYVIVMKKLFRSLFVVCLTAVDAVGVTTGIPDAAPTASQLTNISTRALVQTGDNVIIGGFIIEGTGPTKLILRAIGPELIPYGVPNVLENPTLELHDGTGALIASNDNWQHTIIGGIITADQVVEIQNSGHAPTVATESAIIANF